MIVVPGEGIDARGVTCYLAKHYQGFSISALPWVLISTEGGILLLLCWKNDVRNSKHFPLTAHFFVGIETCGFLNQ